jgi:HEAT repeat protein
VLLATLSSQDEAAFSPALKVLTEIREPRATSVLMQRLESTSRVTSLEEATLLSHICNTLGLLGDRQAVTVLIQFAHRVVDIGRRTNSAKRRENLAVGDPDIPGSVVLAAVIRAQAKLGDRSSISFIAHAVSDLDPYVRVKALIQMVPKWLVERQCAGH